MEVGKSVVRVDAYDKVTGRAKYADDLCDKNALVAKIVHSTIAHGKVLKIDTTEAEKIAGVVKIVTCFDIEKNYYPTAGHPYSLDPGHKDIEDRLVLNEHVRYYGDDVAAVIAENEVAAMQAVEAIKVEYEEYSFELDAQEAMKDGAAQLHEAFPNNILAHTKIKGGNYEEATKEPGLTKIEGWYDTPSVQHCHIENHICFASEEKGRMTVVSSTQIPHIVRRVVATALGKDLGEVRIVKPYIGGGFGNKQDALYEPLCAYLSTQVGGKLVKLENSREETFVNTRVRHAIRTHIISWVRPDGTFAARKVEMFANNGAYASHGHSICAKGLGAFPQLYPVDNYEGDGYTIFTNRPTAGAMRAYGIPQAMFAVESHTDEICKQMGFDPIDFRRQNLMPKGYVDNFSKNCQYYDTFNQVMDKGIKYLDYYKKREEYAKETGPIKHGVGMSVFWYNTGVWPISLESSSCRFLMNQDGSITLMMGETEIGQGADTAFSQMAADAVGVTTDKINIVSTQDTDVSPFGTGAYASRQTYIASFPLAKVGRQLKDKILKHAFEYTRMPYENMDIVENNIVRKSDGSLLMSLKEFAWNAMYSLEHSQQFSAEDTAQIKSNAYTFGCCFADVEIDTEMCNIKVNKLINVHDCGRLINPQLAAMQVHGGMSMGLGYALSEVMLFNEKTGEMLNNNFLDYKLLTTMDHPHLEAQFVENPEPTSPYGAKGLGEPPVPPVAPAIRNAVFAATGVAINELPLRPHKLHQRFAEEGLI